MGYPSNRFSQPVQNQNDLFSSFGGQQGFMNQCQQLSNFLQQQGNGITAEQAVQNLLSSGQLNQQQINQAIAKANQAASILNQFPNI